MASRSFFEEDLPPAAYARELAHELRLNEYPVNVPDLCRELGLAYKESDLGRAYDGCLVRGWENRGRKGILVNRNIPYEGRKRFTVAHEIGHSRIKSHSEPEYWCTADAIENYRSDKAVEREANEFASELLLPENKVREEVDRSGVSMGIVRELAETYGTSLTAAAIKAVKLSRYVACAVAMCAGNSIEWVIRSPRFERRYQMRPPSHAVHQESCASDLLAGRFVPPGPQKVGPQIWLAGGRADIRTLSYVEEDSVLFSHLDRVLTIVTVPDGDAEDEEAGDGWLDDDLLW